MIDSEDLNKTWARIIKDQECKNDAQTMRFIRAIQHGAMVIHNITPSELLAKELT